MANEIEFKIEITKDEYKEFEKNNKNLIEGYVHKFDEYYNCPIKGNVIRIRKSDDDYYLCYKNKNFKGNVEVTAEYETKIKDPDVFRHIMEALNVSVFFTKKKDAMEVVFKNDPMKGKYNIEFVIINDKFYYIEIEWIADFTNKIMAIKLSGLQLSDSNDVIKFLEGKIKELGFDPRNKDSRSWIQIVKDNNPMKSRDPIDMA